MNFDLYNVETTNMYEWYIKHSFKNGRFYYDVSTGKTIEKNPETDQVYVFDKIGNFCIVDAYNNVYDVLDACNRKYTSLYIFHLEMNRMKTHHLQEIERLEKVHSQEITMLSNYIKDLTSSVKHLMIKVFGTSAVDYFSSREIIIGPSGTFQVGLHTK